MKKHEGTIRTLVVVLVGLLVNIVLDVTFDLPMLVRWGIALAMVLLLTLLIEVVRRRITTEAEPVQEVGAAQQTDQSRT